MYRRRANLVTLYSLKTLTKVSSRPINSASLFLDKFQLCRIFSTAIERSDFYSINELNSEKGTDNFKKNENLGTNEQNVNRVYGQNLDNRFGNNQDRNFVPRYTENGQKNGLNSENGTNNIQQNGNLGRNEQDVNRVYGQNSNYQFQHNQDHNFAPAYIENGPKNELLENHNQKNGNFGVYGGSDGKFMWQQNGYDDKREYSGGFQQNGYGNNYGQGFASSGNSSQQSREVNVGSSQSSNGGYSGGNSGNLQQRWDGGNYSGNYENPQHSGVNQGNLQQNYNAGYSGGDFGSSQQSGNLQQNYNAGYSGGDFGSFQKSGNSGYSGVSPGNFQQSWNADTSSQNSGNSLHSWGVGYSDGSNANRCQNWNEHYSQSAGMHQKTSHANYPGNGGNLQFPQGNHDAVNLGTYHGNTGLSNNQGNIGEYQQTTGGSLQSNAGFLPQTSNQFESGYIGTLGESSVKPNEVSESLTEDQLKGTIDELDKFYQEGKLKEAVDVLGLLEGRHISVDLPRYLLLFKLCGEENALEEGKSIHKHLLRSGLHLEVKIYNKILEMYCNCGSLDDAFDVFDKMPMRNLTTWDTMISWLAKNGHGEESVALFTQFKETGLRPDGAMFLGIFSACGILGDTVEGLLHFESMQKDYSIVPSMEHYTSVVDMLGTAGNLDEALEFIGKMPLEPSIEVWEVLMKLCRIHGNLELGDRCAELVEVLDPSRLDEQSRAGYLPLKPSDLAKDKEKKKSGQSFPEGRSRVHEYRAGDKSQPELYDLLRGMKQQLKEAGYIPEVKFVLHDIDQEGKEEALMAHSERLAVAQGLLTSPARYPIRIIKNLRICVDCHNTMKIVSKLVGRELIIRDAKRFHHFKDGLCSCRDYW